MATTCSVVVVGADEEAVADRAQERIRALAAALTRFDPESELSRMNAAARQVVPASDALRALFRAAAGAARATGGLVDASLVGELERAGYVDAPPADLAAALAAAPPRRPARPRAIAPPAAPWWDLVAVGDATVSRPPGLRLDSGGIAKGLIADLVLDATQPLMFVDCGGDIAVGGARADERPWQLAVRHPADGSVAHTFTLARGGIATSGLARRLWLRPDGTPAHHLLDPSTGEPAWTGLLSATALAPSAVEAEALAKAAFLSGPAGARRVLAAGGLLVHESGDVEVV